MHAASRMFHDTPAPICDVPLSTWPVVAVFVVSIWKPCRLESGDQEVADRERRAAAEVGRALQLSRALVRSGSPQIVML